MQDANFHERKTKTRKPESELGGMRHPLPKHVIQEKPAEEGSSDSSLHTSESLAASAQSESEESLTHDINDVQSSSTTEVVHSETARKSEDSELQH